MPRLTLPSAPDIQITLRRTAAARRFSLRVSGLDGRVTLSVPLRAREVDAMAFADTQIDWIRNARARAPLGCVVGEGSLLPFEGREVAIRVSDVRVPEVRGSELLVPPGRDLIGVRAEAFLRVIARDRLAAAADRYAAMLDRRASRVVLRDTRSRWGSCSADGTLMFSWRLILAPTEVLSYVAAHEVAHLAEMNHGPGFWRVVSQLMPGFQPHRSWLRKNGAALHAYRFDAGKRKD